MVFKRFIKKNGKLMGPYYYESYRDENGRVKKRYLGTSLSSKKDDPVESIITPQNKLGFKIKGDRRIFLGAIFGAILVVSFVFLFLFLQSPKQLVVLDIVPTFKLNETLSGKAIITIEAGDYLPSKTILNVMLRKDGRVVAQKTESLDDFFSGILSSNELSDSREVCDEVPIQSTEQVCSEVTDAETGEISSVCEDKSVESMKRECRNESVSLGRVYDKPGKYNNDLESMLNYRLEEPGNYEISFSIDSFDVIATKEFDVVAPSEQNGTGRDNSFSEGGLGEDGEVGGGANNQTISDETIKNEIIRNETINNQTIEVKTTRQRVKLGEPVKWTKEVKVLDENALNVNVTVELPDVAQNISVTAVENGIETNANADITGAVIGEIMYRETLYDFLRKIILSITGRVVDEPANIIVNAIEVNIQDNSSQYSIEYETPAPTATEKITETGKEVVISAPSELNYTDVLSYTDIPEVHDVGQENNIRVYWVENKSDVPFEAFDTDGNGKLDYIEWITPHLSNQTFDIIYNLSSTTIYDCGNITESSGSYSLNQSIEQIGGGNCILVQANVVHINGNGYTINGDIYLSNPIGNAYTGLVIRNLTLNGSIYAVGGDGGNGGSVNLTNVNLTNVNTSGGDNAAGNGGNGGNINLTNSIVFNVDSHGGSSSSGGNGGNAGNVQFDSSFINLTNRVLNLEGGTGTSNGTAGLLTLKYSTTFTDTNADYGDRIRLSLFKGTSIYSFVEFLNSSTSQNSVNSSGMTNLSSSLLLGSNFVFVNSTTLPMLNMSANITFNLGEGIQQEELYRIYKDTQICLDCYNFTKLDVFFIKFNVTSWSRYHIELGSVCGDGLQELGEECDDGNIVNGDGCSEFCLIEYSDNGSVVGGNGGGGGGCSNQCSPSGLKQCLGDSKLVCGNYDSDSCYEWSNLTACATNEYCFNGDCLPRDDTGGCKDTINCSLFGECTNGVKTRSCLKINSTCNRMIFTESSDCSLSDELSRQNISEKPNPGKDCTPNIVCGEYGECKYYNNISDLFAGVIRLTGTQSRECVDKNKCLSKYFEDETCNLNISVELIKEVDPCNSSNEIITTVKKGTNEKVATINLQSWIGAGKFDIRFIENSTIYCSHCYNGIHDSDENGIDCGGLECKKCTENHSLILNYVIPIFGILILFLMGFILFLFWNSKEDKLKEIRKLIKFGEQHLKPNYIGKLE